MSESPNPIPDYDYSLVSFGPKTEDELRTTLLFLLDSWYQDGDVENPWRDVLGEVKHFLRGVYHLRDIYEPVTWIARTLCYTSESIWTDSEYRIAWKQTCDAFLNHIR